MIFNVQTQDLVNDEIEGSIIYRSHWVKYCTFDYIEPVSFQGLANKDSK